MQKAERVDRQVAGLCAVVIGEKLEPGPIVAFEQDSSAGRLPLGGRGAEHHGVGLYYQCGHRFVEPHRELLERVVGDTRTRRSEERRVGKERSIAILEWLSGIRNG